MLIIINDWLLSALLVVIGAITTNAIVLMKTNYIIIRCLKANKKLSTTKT